MLAEHTVCSARYVANSHALSRAQKDNEYLIERPIELSAILARPYAPNRQKVWWFDASPTDRYAVLAQDDVLNGQQILNNPQDPTSQDHIFR